MKVINKDIVREIFKTKIRFLSIFIMTTLGVSTFIGLNSIEYDMYETLDTIYRTYNGYDLKINNFLGFDDVDKNIIFENNNDILEYEFSYQKEIFFKNNKNIFRINSIPKKISKLILKSGKYPTKNDEIVIDYSFINEYKIGDTITLENNEKFTITGFILNIENVDNSKEISYSGYQQVYMNAYTIDEYFKDENFKILRLKINDLNNLYVSDKNYIEKSYLQKKKFEDLFLNKEKEKIDKISIKIDEGIVKINNSKKILENSEKKLTNAKNIINNKKNELENNKSELLGAKDKFKENEIKLNDSINKIEDGIKIITNKRNELSEKKSELLENKEKISDGLKQINDGILTIDNKNSEIIEKKKEVLKQKEYIESLSINIFTKRKIEDGKKQIEEALKNINDGIDKLNYEKKNLIEKKNELNKNLEKLENGISEIDKGLNKLDEEYNKIIENKKLVNENQKKLLFEKDKFENSYDDNIKKINNGFSEILKQENILNNNLDKFNREKDNAIKEIDTKYDELKNVKKEINNIKKIYSVETRIDNPEYLGYMEQITSIKIVAKLFPIIFYLIVILVTSTTMTRMIDEQRHIIGTYKFLGYDNKSIRNKYILYAIIPTILGIILGIYFGVYIFPKILYKAYSINMIDDLKKLIILFNYKYIIISILLSLLSTLFSVLLAIKNELKLQVSELLKPKIPKKGSKILLENINFIWKNLKFSNKITFRNIFRYKSRMFMNILGVAGCTSLIFLGFSMKNTYTGISDKQYGEIIKYDATINLKNNLNIDEIKKVIDKAKEKGEIYELYKINTKIRNNNFKEYNIETLVIDDVHKFNDFFEIKDLNNNNINLLKEKSIISDRTLSLLNKSINEDIVIDDYYGVSRTFNFSRTFENYFFNYIITTKDNYIKNIKTDYTINTILIKSNNTNFDDLLNLKEIQSISLNSKYKEKFETINESFTSIILFLIILSATLSIIITYSLLNININERKRELSTIKVLGFYNKEVSLYIYKEIIILTIIGILFGFIGGNILHKIVVYSMKSTQVIFLNNIGYTPYIFSALFTIIFSIISMLLVYFDIIKINMVEALKGE